MPILAIVLAVRAIGIEGGPSLTETTKRSFGYGLRAYPSSLATLPIRRFDTLVLGATGQTAQLGLYTAGVNIAETAMYLPNSVANVLLPESAGQDDPVRAAVLVRKASVVVMTIMVIGGGAGILLAPWIVHTLFGSAYAGSVLPLQLMMVAMLGQSTRRVYGAGLMARNKAGTVSIVTRDHDGHDRGARPRADPTARAPTARHSRRPSPTASAAWPSSPCIDEV